MQVTKKDLRTFWNRRWRLENCYRIKGEQAGLIKLKFNEAQERLWNYAEEHDHKGMRLVNTKVRKRGVTTFWATYYLDETLFIPNKTTCILAHTKDDQEKIFRIVKIAYDSMAPAVQLETGKVWLKPKPTYDNKNELHFREWGSSIYVALQNRGVTNHNLHISEAAHVVDSDRIKATLGSVPPIGKGSNITVESTANGVGGWFYDTYNDAEAGLSLYEAMFFSWIDDPKYRIKAPKAYEPSKDVLVKANLVKQHFGMTLNRDQMFWWDMTRQEQKGLMDQEFPTIAADSFLVSGDIAFDPESVRAITPKDPVGTKFGVSYWKKPKEGRQYVIALDPAEGVEGDNSALEVWDKLTLEQVAEYASNTIKPTDFADLADKIGRWYNNAIMAPERNNHGHTVIQRLKDKKYPAIFKQVVFDEKKNKKGKKLGWETNGRTRDLVLDEFEDFLDDKTIKINSAKLKSEMQTFIINEKGKRIAKQGCKDDRIMATAICLKVCTLPRRSITVASIN